MSYQDVSWGYHEKSEPTDHPLRQEVVDEVLRDLGYELKTLDPYCPILQWKNKNGDVISLPRPQYTSSEFSGLVYDKNDIVDFFTHFSAGHGGDGIKILAKLQAVT
jgi:hypothetical protein